MNPYTVMVCENGDELVLSHHPDYLSAAQAMREHRRTDPRADVSVWHTKHGLVA